MMTARDYEDQKLYFKVAKIYPEKEKAKIVTYMGKDYNSIIITYEILPGAYIKAAVYDYDDSTDLNKLYDLILKESKEKKEKAMEVYENLSDYFYNSVRNG